MSARKGDFDIYLNGAVEILLNRCSDALNSRGELISLNRAEMMRLATEMSAKGLGVLAFAKSRRLEADQVIDPAIKSENLIFLLPMRLILSIILSNLLVIFYTNQSLAQPYITQGDVPAERDFRTVTLVEGLEHPWSMAWLPNSDILITERPRRLRWVRDDRLIPDPVSGVPEVFASGQGGLLDVSLPLRFNQNCKVYFTNAHGTAKANRTRVASAVLNNDAVDNWQVIFEVATVKPGSQHFGSRLIWLPDGMLYVLTDESHGSLIQLEPTSDRDSPEAP